MTLKRESFITKLESNAIKFELLKFRALILEAPIWIKSVHKASQFLFSSQRLSNRFNCRMPAIQDYTPKIEYIKGTNIIVADILSRAGQSESKRNTSIIAAITAFKDTDRKMRKLL